MSDWNWEAIDVLAGQWWLLILFIVTFAVGVVAGMAYDRRGRVLD